MPGISAVSAADQRAAGLQAAFGNTVDHAGGGIDIGFTRGIVIEGKTAVRA